jgi:hypothetical protein
MPYVTTVVFNGYDAPCGRVFEPFVASGGEMMPRDLSLEDALRGAENVANLYAGHADITVTEVVPGGIQHPLPPRTERCYDCGRNWATNVDHDRPLCTRCLRAVEHDADAHRRRVERRQRLP